MSFPTSSFISSWEPILSSIFRPGEIRRRFCRWHLVVSNRGTDPLPSLESLKASFGEEAANRVKFVCMPSIDISSREIRRKVNRRESIRFLVPRAVEQVIVERKLYVVDREEISPADSTQSA